MRVFRRFGARVAGALTPDGVRYMHMASGHIVPKPYNRRWLLPTLLGPHPLRWAITTYVSLVATPFLAWMYFGGMGLTGNARLFAACLLSALPGVWRCSWRFPVLLDAPSFAAALAVAAITLYGPPWFTVLAALALGAMRETGPLFAALWSWSPWPLAGLIATGWFRKAAPPDVVWLSHPYRAALDIRRRIGLDADLYLRPWGATLVGLCAPTWQMAATVVLAHLQLFAAQDTMRLTVWCAPVLVLSAAHVIPPTWYVLAIIVTFVQHDDRV